MADVIISPNMNLPVPEVGIDPGQDWANNINACLGILDQHDHSSGSGVQITPAGLDINADLNINSNNLTSVKTVNFTPQLTFLPGVSPNLGCIYVAGNELYYNDEAGNVVAITKTGSVNAGAGSITGLPSGTASATYSSISKTFVWQSATSTPANMDFASAIFRNLVANSFGLTLNPPSAMGSDYSVTLPPINTSGSTAFLTYDTANNMGVGPATNGLTDANIAPKSLTNASIANGTITQQLLQPRATGTTVPTGGVGISISSTTVTKTSTSYTNIDNGTTNLTVTITTTGRPVWVGFLPVQGDNDSLVQINNNTSTQAALNGFIAFLNNGTIIASNNIVTQLQLASPANVFNLVGIPPSSFSCLDMTVNGVPGTYTYTAQAKVSGAGAQMTIINMQLVAYEI